MGMIFELEESEFAGYIDDGARYAATVAGIKKREKPFKDDNGQAIIRVEFHFKLIADDGHDGQDIWGDTSTRFNSHPECRLKQWSEAILGMHLAPHFRLDTDMLLDRHCFVVIGKKEWQKDGELKVRNFVRDVQPTTANAKALAESDDPF
jgi:hypothetical protein